MIGPVLRMVALAVILIGVGVSALAAMFPVWKTTWTDQYVFTVRNKTNLNNVPDPPDGFVIDPGPVVDMMIHNEDYSRNIRGPLFSGPPEPQPGERLIHLPSVPDHLRYDADFKRKVINLHGELHASRMAVEIILPLFFAAVMAASVLFASRQLEAMAVEDDR